MKTLLIAGGAGFIGSNFIHYCLAHPGIRVINLDALTYAGNLENLASVESHPEYRFVHGDIGDQALVSGLLADSRPDAVINFAAESHVDRSIDGPELFVQTNVNGTLNLLQQSQLHWNGLNASEKSNFRYLQVSTDEVYGSLGPEGAFTETTAYAPNSPYAASKAAADHLVRAYFHTYGLPTLTTNCSNNYGPWQFPEKLIPLVTQNALAGKPLPIYGDGKQVRDWLFVEDHCQAISTVLDCGLPGEVYNIGGAAEMTNLEVVNVICDLLDELKPREDGNSYAGQITFVKDRPGHDRRYAIDFSKINRELGWQPGVSFSEGMKRTINWYLQNQTWVENVLSGSYRGERLGLGVAQES